METLLKVNGKDIREGIVYKLIRNGYCKQNSKTLSLDVNQVKLNTLIGKIEEERKKKKETQDKKKEKQEPTSVSSQIREQYIRDVLSCKMEDFSYISLTGVPCNDVGKYRNHRYWDEFLYSYITNFDSEIFNLVEKEITKYASLESFSAKFRASLMRLTRYTEHLMYWPHKARKTATFKRKKNNNSVQKTTVPAKRNNKIFKTKNISDDNKQTTATTATKKNLPVYACTPSTKKEETATIKTTAVYEYDDEEHLSLGEDKEETANPTTATKTNLHLYACTPYNNAEETATLKTPHILEYLPSSNEEDLSLGEDSVNTLQTIVTATQETANQKKTDIDDCKSCDNKEDDADDAMKPALIRRSTSVTGTRKGEDQLSKILKTTAVYEYKPSDAEEDLSLGEDKEETANPTTATKTNLPLYACTPYNNAEETATLKTPHVFEYLPSSDEEDLSLGEDLVNTLHTIVTATQETANQNKTDIDDCKSCDNKEDDADDAMKPALIRRSTRVTATKKREDQLSKILSLTSDESLGLEEVYISEVNGRGVITTKDIQQGDLVLEYTGELISRGMGFIFSINPPPHLHISIILRHFSYTFVILKIFTLPSDEGRKRFVAGQRKPGNYLLFFRDHCIDATTDFGMNLL